jgi:hypothetical protein
MGDMGDGVASECSSPGFRSRHVRDHDIEPICDSREKAPGCRIHRRGIDHDEPGRRVDGKPVAAEHAHDESRSTGDE